MQLSRALTLGASMGLLGRLTGWDQQKDAHNAVVASNFIEAATPDVKCQIIQCILEIQKDVKGRYAGSSNEILDDLNKQPRSVQMNFVALACNNLGIQPSIRGLYFNDVQNPYLAKGKDTTERIDGVVKFINSRYPVCVSWPGDAVRENFKDWLTTGPSNAQRDDEATVERRTKHPQQSSTISRCPACSQPVRFPAGKDLRIKCPTCAHTWIEKTSAGEVGVNDDGDDEADRILEKLVRITVFSDVAQAYKEDTGRDLNDYFDEFGVTAEQRDALIDEVCEIGCIELRSADPETRAEARRKVFKVIMRPADDFWSELEQADGSNERPYPVLSVEGVYEVLHEISPRHKVDMQALVMDPQGRKIDRLSIRTAEGIPRTVYFRHLK